MMRKFIFVIMLGGILLSFISSPLLAQDLQHISTSSELYTFSSGSHKMDMTTSTEYRYTIEKLLRLPGPHRGPIDRTKVDGVWSSILYSMTHDERVRVYQTDQLSQELSIVERKLKTQAVDTIYDPVTYNIKIISYDFPPDDYVDLKVQQEVSWNANTNTVNFIANACIPLLQIGGDGYETCWTSLKEYPEEELSPWENMDVTFIATAELTIPLNNLHIEALFSGVLTKEEEVMLYESPESIKPMTMPERTALITPQIDTVINCWGNENEPPYFVIENTFDWKHIQYLRLMTRWYWNDRQKQLYYRFLAWAPMLRVWDENGNYKYDTPLFYRFQ